MTNFIRRITLILGWYAPGPGTYQAKEMIGNGPNKALVIPRRNDVSPQVGKSSPGPCAYQIKTRNYTHGIRIGTSKRYQSLENMTLPSPSQYSPNYEVRRKSRPAWT